ncbi:MAG: AlkZ family DNA glycosylase [Actinobacteria bacterium]|nr:AlkZ family DNA glycosylase [Actinomycetota bacterium]
MPARDEELIARRLAAQQLTGPPAVTAVDVVRRLLAVQGQDARGVRLAVRARSAGLTAADVDQALTAERSLLITWLNRGTLHLVTAEDYGWLHALTTPPLITSVNRRLGQEGVPPGDADRAVAVAQRALADDGPLTRAQLRERIAAAGVRTEGQAIVHILALASLRGLIVRGPTAGRDHAFVLARDWLGAAAPPWPRERALAELARRYLAGHGPASDRDLAKWAGLPLRDARRGLAAISASLAERSDGLAELAGAGASYGLPPPRLLGAFDPLLLGWSSRADIVDPGGPVVTSNGLFRPFVLAGGWAAGLWNISGGTVTLSLFAPLAAADRTALDAEVADVRRFLSLAGSGQGSPAGCTG